MSFRGNNFLLSVGALVWFMFVKILKFTYYVYIKCDSLDKYL